VTNKTSKAAATAMIAAHRVETELDKLFDEVRGWFARIEPRLQARRYILACMSGLDKRNGWSIGEAIGDARPDKTQRLLSRASWNEDAVLRAVRGHVIRGLDSHTTPRRKSMSVLALDETGQEKKGDSTAGVKRQHMGCAGGVENGINTVHLSYIRQGTGHAIIGFRQWIPEEHLTDPQKAKKTGLPHDLESATKGQLAVKILKETHDEGHRADFIAGDEVYGSSPDVREYCEDNSHAYVLRVRSDFPLTLAGGTKLTCKELAKKHLKGKKGWKIHPAGSGSKGARLYAWAWIGTQSPTHSLLIRRHIKTGELAYHYCFIPAGRPCTLKTLITAAGLRWPIEECFEFGKDYFGLDQSQVRLYRAIKRHTVLIITALAIFAVIAASTRRQTSTQAPPPRNPDEQPPASPGTIPLTIHEIKRMFEKMIYRHHPDWHHARWLDFRLLHQTRAAWFHQRTRLARDLTLAPIKL
jgi:SRSO17 transposase